MLVGGRILVSVAEGDVLRVDAGEREVELFADTLKKLGVDMRHVRRILGWRTSLRFPSLLHHAGWRFSLVFEGERVLVAGRGVSALTGHVSVSLKRILELA